MRSTLLLLTLSFTLAVSCKNKDKTTPNPPEPPATGETVRARIRLSGDILSSESPLPNGRKADNTPQYAKELRDSTLYGIMVKTGANFNTTISRGLFNNTDSIMVDLPVGGEYKIIAYAYKRGTGTGLYYELKPGEPPPYSYYYGWPLYSVLRNRMDTTGPIVEHFNTIVDTLARFELFDPIDSTKIIPVRAYSEIDAYRGEVTLTTTGAPAIVSINLKRMAFGIRFTAANFTEGKLHAGFSGGYIAEQRVTPGNIDEKYFIYSANGFRYSDSLYPVTVVMSWEKPDGSSIPLGEKSIVFKRNVLTTVHVTVSDTGRTQIVPIITETDWAGTETVDF